MSGTLKMMVMVAVVILATASSLLAQIPVKEGWVPSGYVALSLANKSYSSGTSYVYYDKPYAMVDAWLNLPAGFSLEVDEYAGLNGLTDLDNDDVDEFDALLWKKFQLAPDTYLTLRFAYFNCFPVGQMNGDDVFAYDTYLGHNIKLNENNSLTVQLRTEYSHQISNIESGRFSVLPSVSHEYKTKVLNLDLVLYDKIGLQWNSKSGPLCEEIAVQASVGASIPVSKSLTWNVIDVMGMLPITQIDDSDPRSQKGALVFSTTLSYNF